MIDDYAPERMAAREQMRAAMYWYARAIDRGQSHFMDRVFHDGATVDCGVYQGNVAGFRAMLDERRARVPRAIHMIGNILFDFLGDHTAFTESYCLALEEFLPEAADQPGLNRLARVRYADDFECRDGIWKITHHVIVVDHAMAPEPVGGDGFFNGPPGRRDAEDFVLTRRRALGLD